MMIRSGMIQTNKKDRECLRIALEHAKEDLSYGVGGSYGDGDNWNKRGEHDKGNEGIRLIEWMLKELAF